VKLKRTQGVLGLIQFAPYVNEYLATSIPDEKKGEQLVLITTQENITSKELMQKAQGVASISLPKKFITVEKLPVLATGKVNYPTVTQLALDHFKT
jgi:acyl-[acyl-carrier-protein]-phospholipid O-acyltransferase/long-chain-fatty-acid--[acyl-carrier-protein] ligase